MHNSNDSKLAKRMDAWINIAAIRTTHGLRREISRRSDGNPLRQFWEPGKRERASVIGEDLTSFYTLVEDAGQREVRDLFTPNEAGALIGACENIELNQVDPATMTWALHLFHEKTYELDYWSVEELPILRKIASLSLLAQYFLVWRLDEQARLSGHCPTHDTIELVLEDIGLRSRNWGEDGWSGNTPRLYNASVIVPEYSGCKDVDITLLRYCRPRPVLPYRQLLGEGYDKVDDDMLDYAEGAVDELFTKREVEYVTRYIEKAYGLKATPHEYDVPGDVGTMGVTGLPVGGGVGAVLLGDSENPELPFPVAGCYDLRRHVSDDEADSQKEEEGHAAAADEQQG